MKSISLALGAGASILAGAVIFWACSHSDHGPKLDSPYQAVLLDNGQAYYGKIDRLDSEFLTLSEVYYVERQADPETKSVTNILVRRGTEWHAPNRSIICVRHVIVVEPVTPGSKVADLIAALRRQASGGTR
jgi:hypothetical protein